MSKVRRWSLIVLLCLALLTDITGIVIAGPVTGAGTDFPLPEKAIARPLANTESGLPLPGKFPAVASLRPSTPRLPGERIGPANGGLPGNFDGPRSPGQAFILEASLETTSTFSHSLALQGGYNDFVEISHHTDLNPSSGGELTIEAWVRRARAGEYEAIVNKGGMDNYYWLSFSPDVLHFGVNGQSRDGVTTVPVGVWTHVAVVWAGDGSLRYYINGDLDYSGDLSTQPITNTASLLIGAAEGQGSYLSQFAGNIAGVRIWNVARDQDDIRRTMHVALEEPRPGLVANWHLSDDYKDNIGGHDGIPRGSASLDGPQAPPRPALVPVDKDFNSLPVTRYGAATVYIPNRNHALLIGGSYTTDVYAVDASTGEATSLNSSLPYGLALAGAAYAPGNDTAYAFGGSSSPLSLFASQDILALDPDGGYVRTLTAALPTGAANIAVVYHAGLDKIYIMGGFGYKDLSAIRLSTISVFDPASETIEGPLGFSLPEARYGMAAAYSSATGKIYLFGGKDGADADTDTIYEMTVGPDGQTGQVTLLAARLPQPSYGLSAVEDPTSRLIYLLGGRGSERVLVFDPASGEAWETLITLEERTYTSAIYTAHNRHALLMGGADAADAEQKNVWRIPLGDGPAVPLGHWDFPAPVGAEVTAIDGDESRMLVATRGDGLWRYEESWQRYHYTPGVLNSASGVVNDARYNAANDHVWIASDDAGGLLDDGSSIQTYLNITSVLAVDTRPGYTDPTGAPFFGVGYGGGLRWRVALLQPPGAYIPKTNFRGQDVKAVAHRAAGDAWVIASNRLKHLSYTDVMNPIETDYGDRQCGLTQPGDVVFGANDDWWIVSGDPGEVAQPGICRIPAGLTPAPGVARLADPLIGNQVTAVDVDAESRIWVSIRTHFEQSGGLAVFEAVGSPATIRTDEFNWLNGPVGGRILEPWQNQVWESGFSAVGAADERVWAGKSDGELVTLAQRWQQLDESNSLDNQVISGVWTVRGRLFLASQTLATPFSFNSLQVLNPDGKTWDSRFLGSSQAYVVFGDSRGRIWVGTDSGASLYTAGGWGALGDVEGTPPAGPVYALAEDGHSRIWIGGAGGLTLFDRDRFVLTLTGSNSSLPTDTVKALLVDRDNRLWVGTTDGLARLDSDDSLWIVYTTTHGLPGNAVRDLVQLGDGRIAISTDGGLGLYDEGGGFSREYPPIEATNLPLSVDELGRLWAGSAVRTAGGWQGYYWANSGLRYSIISDNATDGADRVWFGHAPGEGLSVRGAYLPPLAHTIPVVTSISPDHGRSGDLITVSGTGFGSNPSNVKVTIGGALVEVVSLSDTAITTRLNDNNISGGVSVSVGRRRAFYPGFGRPAFCAEPMITGFTPTGGNDGVPVEIAGRNFDPYATLTLGSGLPRTEMRNWAGPTRLVPVIRPGDGNGLIQVTNDCPGGPAYTATSTGEFQRIELSLQKVALNQGMEFYGLVANRPTLIQHYLGHSRTPRSTDRLEVELVEITFANASGKAVSYTIPYSGTFATSPGAPPPAWLKDIATSLNVFLTPWVGKTYYSDHLFSSDTADLQVRSVLRNGDYTLAQATHTARFRRNVPLTVLLVPIMKEGYSKNDLWDMQYRVDRRLDELKWRIMPPGQVQFLWSNGVCTESSVDIGSWYDLYDVSHCMDRQRRRYNNSYNPDMQVAFGVVHQDVAAGSTASGKAFWPDLSKLLNTLALDVLDTLCDIGNALLKIFSFGFAGSDDGCQLEVPLYVGWARGDADQISSLFGHEIGHIHGLVDPAAPNGSWSDNFSHSVNDELDGGECYSGGTSYNPDKTLYRQPGVTEPVVNPIAQGQLYPQLSGDQSTLRGKAMMSYACGRNDDNVFFEPADLVAMSLGISTFGAFLPPFSSSAEAAVESATNANASRPFAMDQTPMPRYVPGQRIYVSGIVSKTTNSGELRLVEVLGEDAPLDASYVTGYWLAQLDGDGVELGRTGIFPVFATEDSPENDIGFFATTLLRRDGVTRLELRYEDTVLDSFTAGSNPPSLSLSSPSGGAYSSGEIPVTWTASDPDGDALEIAILYSADDGASWAPLTFSNGSGTVNVPVYQLAGSDQARFQVIASDGFNSTSISSTVFSVAAQPPRPYIGHPAAGSAFLEGQRIMLSGGAGDNQDKTVADANLRWRSDRDGDLGAGSQLGVFLSVGTHVLTLEAANSLGLTASVTTSLRVEGDYDYDGILDNEELAEGLSPLTENDAYSDADGDGLPLIVERKRGLNPDKADSDSDGRDDAEEVVAGTDPLTSDVPLPTDALAVSPTSLTFEADLSLDTPLPQKQVHVTSRSPVSWTLATDVGWLAASATSGRTPAGPTIQVRAFELDEGLHAGHLIFTSDELGSAITVPVTVTVTNSASFFDVGDDGYLNVGDVQEVADRIPSDNSQEGFSYRHDVDRDGDVDEADASLMGRRWEDERNCCSTAYPTATATLRASAPPSVAVGSLFTVAVLIEGAQNALVVAGFEFDLAFDPAVLEVQGARLGDLLGSTGRTSAALGPVMNNTTGSLAFGGYTYGEQAGVSADGLLTQIIFRAIAPGSSILDIQNPLLADPGGALSVALDQDAWVEASSSLCEPLTGVSINGSNWGLTNTVYSFVATFSPSYATRPIIYTWSPLPDEGQGAVVSYTWTTTGTKTISVTASNCGGAGIASDDHTIRISALPGGDYEIYLPLVLRGS